MKVIGIVGPSDVGKTTLIEKLIDCFVEDGLRVSTLKQTKDFTIDHPGKDTDRFRAAGATEVMVASPSRFALMRHVSEEELSLEFLLSKLALVDIVLAEGFRLSNIPKVEVRRAGFVPRKPWNPVSGAVAIASDLPVHAAVPTLPLNEPGKLAAYISSQLELRTGREVALETV